MNSISGGFKKIKWIPAAVLTLMLTGCSSIDTDSDIYENIKRQTERFSSNAGEAADGFPPLSEMLYTACIRLKKVAPAIIVISILIGCLLLHVITEDQAVRKKALVLFIIGIPVLTAVVTYGMSWLVGGFM